MFAGLEQAAAIRNQCLEPGGVKVVRSNHEPIARWLAQQHAGRRAGRAVGFQDAAEMGHVGLQRADGLRRGLMPPQLFYQSVQTHHAIGVHQQYRQHRALLAPTQRQRPPVRNDLKRSEDPELQVPPPRFAELRRSQQLTRRPAP